MSWQIKTSVDTDLRLVCPCKSIVWNVSENKSTMKLKLSSADLYINMHMPGGQSMESLGYMVIEKHLIKKTWQKYPEWSTCGPTCN